MKLYEFAPTRSIRVRWTLQELGIDFEAVPVNLLAGEHHSPAFLKLNPAGKLPVLVDGDMVLTESIAIVLYLAEKYRDKGLMPADLQQRAQLMRWLLFTTTELEQPLWRMARHTRLYPEEKRLPAELALAREDLLTVAVDLFATDAGSSRGSTRTTGQRWRKCSTDSRVSRLTWTTCTRGHARRCALKKPSPASSADRRRSTAYWAGTPTATGRTGEPEFPCARSGRMMVHESHTLSWAIAPRLAFWIW